jgi:putative transposase
MSRPLRLEYQDAWYHVMNRGRRGEEIFTGKDDYRNFIEILKETARLWKLRIAAYCLMANHYHLLVQTPRGNISRCMRHIDGVYTQRFNKLHSCDGQLFRGRYKSILVDADRYLLPLLRYIHRNPLRAGLADTLEDYEWTSHKGYLSTVEKWNWLHKAFILSLFSGKKLNRIGEYRRFISLEDEEGVLGVLEKRRWPSVLGSEGFVNWIKERYYSCKWDDEVPQSKELAPEVSRIRKEVCVFYGIGQGELLGSRRGVFNEPRNVAIYLTRQLRGESLRQIGLQFQMAKYSSVSSVIERIRGAMIEDRKLRARIEKLIFQLSKSQEQT